MKLFQTSVINFSMLVLFLLVISPAFAQVPMNERHPDAGIWMAYPRSPLSDLNSYPYISEVKGVMAYQTWASIYTSSGSFNWDSLDTKLNAIINVADKKAFIITPAGYCPNLPIPEYLSERIASRRQVNGQGCRPLQYWDPLFLSYNSSTDTYSGYYWDYLKALGEHLAYFDTHDDRPNVTDIAFVRALVMADTQENLAGTDDIAALEWEWQDFDPAPLTGRRYQVNLTNSINSAYYERVSLAYVKAFQDAYNAVGLIPPTAAPKMNGHWSASPEQNNLADAGHYLWVTNSDPVPPGAWYFGYIQKVKNTNTTRGHTESGHNMGDTTLLGLWNYWEVLANVHAGVEFIGIYGQNRALEETHPTLQPYGPIGFSANVEGLRFGNKYAGVERVPATAPGAFIALRGWYPEYKFSGLEHETLWTNYNVLITQYRPQDSVMLFSEGPTTSSVNLSPRVRRNQQMTTSGWAAEVDLCDNPGEWPASECEYIHQPPSVYNGMDGSAHIHSYPTTDLGTVRFCGEDMFCTNGGTVTRTEDMFWARRTDRANGQNYLRFNLQDAFASSLGSAGSRSVRIRVVYLDRGTDRWQLQRDNGVVIGTITKANSDNWKEAFFDVSNASFNNTGTGGTDLALYNNSDLDDFFHMIEVERLTNAPSNTPTPTTPSTSPTPPVTDVTIQPVSCIDGPVTTNAATVSWTNPPGDPATMVQVTLDPGDYIPSFVRRDVSGLTSVPIPDGFTENQGTAALELQPDTEYSLRIWNGAYTPSFTFTIPTCTATPGDTNGDTQVNLTDLSVLLSNFGGTGKNLSQGDVSGSDGVVNVADLALLLARFGM